MGILKQLYAIVLCGSDKLWFTPTCVRFIVVYMLKIHFFSVCNVIKDELELLAYKISLIKVTMAFPCLHILVLVVLEVPAYMSPFQASLLRRITCAILWLTFEGKEKISEKSTTKYHLNLSRILKKAIIQ